MNRDLRILMLEDTQPDAELILRELDRQGMRCTTKQVVTEAEFPEQLGAFLLKLGHDYDRNVPALELRLRTSIWWRRTRFSSSKLRRDFSPASARRSRTISQRIMRQRIPANNLEAQHCQMEWSFCQRQGSPASLLSRIFPPCPSLLAPAPDFPTGSKTIEPANAGKNETP